MRRTTIRRLRERYSSEDLATHTRLRFTYTKGDGSSKIREGWLVDMIDVSFRLDTDEGLRTFLFGRVTDLEYEEYGHGTTQTTS